MSILNDDNHSAYAGGYALKVLAHAF